MTPGRPASRVFEAANASAELAREVVLTREPRNRAIDFTKGALVLIMVVYHWLNYFVASAEMIYTYLRFLTPSFIFVSGFLVSNVYRASGHAALRALASRLAIRGLKLVGICLALNLAIALLVQSAPTPGLCRTYWSQLFGLCSGSLAPIDGGGMTLSFTVLLPIGYVLLISAGLTLVSKRYRAIFPAACVIATAAAIVLEIKRSENTTVDLISIGLLGAALGSVGTRRLDLFIVKRTLLLIAAYALYVAAITVWGVPYPVQISGVCLSLMLIYRLGLYRDARGTIAEVVVLLGKYSLFGYIAQIAILQLLRRGTHLIDIGVYCLPASFLFASLLTIVSVVALDQTKHNVKMIDRVYRAVFA